MLFQAFCSFPRPIMRTERAAVSAMSTGSGRAVVPLLWCGLTSHGLSGVRGRNCANTCGSGGGAPVFQAVTRQQSLRRGRLSRMRREATYMMALRPHVPTKRVSRAARHRCNQSKICDGSSRSFPNIAVLGGGGCSPPRLAVATVLWVVTRLRPLTRDVASGRSRHAQPMRSRPSGDRWDPTTLLWCPSEAALDRAAPRPSGSGGPAAAVAGGRG
jgi:hypothetical protein